MTPLVENVNMKKALSKTHFDSDDGIIATLENILNSRNKNLCEAGIKSLQHCWQKCINGERDYFQK